MRQLTLFKLFSVLLLCALSAPILAQNCGDVITSNVRLARSLDCNSGYYIFDVQADNVTIDLNGHSLSGGLSLDAIHNNGYKNMTIKNGFIIGVNVGIIAHASPNLRVNNVSFSNVRNGINISQSNNALIEKNKFIGLDVDTVSVNIINNDNNTETSFNRVQNNDFYEVGRGVRICGVNADSNVVQNNVFWKSSSWAISASVSNNNLISHNRIIDPVGTPIRLNSASSNRVSTNTLIGTGNPLQVENVSGIWVTADTSDVCAGPGIAISSNNTIANNHISDFPVGIAVGSGVFVNFFMRNYFGVLQPSVSNNWVNGNQLFDNDIGIQFKIDATQNNAERNYFRGNTQRVENGSVGNTF